MASTVRGIALLGSTGSIGCQTLEVVRAHPQRLKVVALAAGRRAELLARQVAEFQPRWVYCQAGLPPEGCAPARQVQTLEEIATCPEAERVVIGTTGQVGLAPALAALAAGKDVAIANKEVLISAGPLVMAEAQRSGARVLPIDSEHSAIWQCLQHKEPHEVTRLVLTASGGAFRDRQPETLPQVTPAEALQHPTWHMGHKVTIDSATLINKGFEVMETHWLFGIPYERIEVAIHRESIVHAVVEFVDGSVQAQLSLPDMRLPIQYALSYPERWDGGAWFAAGGAWPRADFTTLGRLTFEAPDYRKYPCLALALEAARQGGTYPAVLSAADEVAVQLFLERRLAFIDIAPLLQGVLERHKGVPDPSLPEILEADAWARQSTLAAAERHQ